MQDDDTKQVHSDELLVTLLDYSKDDHKCEILATGFLVSEDPGEIDIDSMKSFVSEYLDKIRQGSLDQTDQEREEDYQEFQKLFSLPIRMILAGDSNEEDVYSCTYFLFQGTNKIVAIGLSESEQIVVIYIAEPTHELRILKSNFSDSVTWQ